jgi:hypothetical protein
MSLVAVFLHALASALPQVQSPPVQGPPVQGPSADARVEDLRAAAVALAAIGVEVDARRVTVRDLGDDELIAQLSRSNADLFGPEWFPMLWVALHALGLPVEATADAFRRDYVYGILEAQVAWYAAQDHAMLLRRRRPSGTDLPLLFVHELVHAVQDQRAGPGALCTRLAWAALGGSGCCQTTDSALVARCLTEGEAVAAAEAVRLRRDHQELCSTPPARYDVTPEEEADQAMLLHYALGRAFAVRAFRRGGWAEVRAAVEHPPADAAAFLHPDRRDWSFAPDLALPDWPASAGKAKVLREDTWGELGLRLLLRFVSDRSTAVRLAAVGWRGDAMRVFHTEQGRYAFVWRIVFDRGEDAAQFQALLGDGTLGKVAVRGSELDWALGDSQATTLVLAQLLAQTAAPPPASAAAAAATAACEAAIESGSPRVVDGRWQLPRLGVSLPVPEGFEADERRGIPVLFAPVAKDADAGTFRDNLVAVAPPPLAATLAEEIEGVRKRLVAAGATMVAAEVRQVGGRDVAWFEYSTRDDTRHLHHVEVQWLRDGGKVAIAGTALEGRWAAIGPRLSQVLRELRFL